jgi:hypothetical protein
MRDTLLTPRPAPNRVLPVLAGALVLVFALPIFLLAGWPVAGWGLAAVLWLALHALDFLLARMRTGAGNLAASGVQAFGIFFKSIGLLVVLIAAAASSPRLAIAAVLTYALAYTFELGLSLVSYYGRTP